MTLHSPDWLTLHGSEADISIDPLGAQLSSLRDRDGRQFLWQGDPAYWTGRAPLLFPVVGTLNRGHYRLGGRTFALARHGFARGSRFEVEARSDTQARLVLRDTEASREAFPFAFRLEVEYRMECNAVTVTSSVHNTGDVPLPASLGYHPGFAWPLPGSRSRADHVIDFEREEPAPIRRLDAAGLLSPDTRPTPVEGRRLPLADALFAEDVVIFDRFESRRLTYRSDSDRRIEIEFPDARYLGLWTRPGAPFVCIEPWQGVSDPAGFDGDLFAKPGIFTVAPGDVHAFAMTIRLRRE